MKVLWITNIVFPEALGIMTGDCTLKSSGGWMLGAADALVCDEEMSLTVAAPSSLVKELKLIHGEKIDYYLIPKGKGNSHKNSEYENYWRVIKEDLSPDVVHIYGTEFSHGLAYVEACGNDRVVVSIQGLTSAYAHYFHYGLTQWEILRNLTLRDIIQGGLFKGKRDFRKRGEYEIELIRKVKHIIGRTSWDKAYSWAYNPNAAYHHSEETLRPIFYYGRWEYSKCVPHSIFVSQCYYPIKGLHQLLKALPLILRSYPDTIVAVSGGGGVSMDFKLKDRIKWTGYRRYLYRLINKLKISEHVLFLGPLNSEEMKQQFMKSNVFVCPSAIENSPNSLGEAQLLGVPCISSYVGGTMDMMKGDEVHLYRFEEVEMLAHKVIQLFNQAGNIDTDYMREVAKKRHDPNINVSVLKEIYKSIIDH